LLRPSFYGNEKYLEFLRHSLIAVVTPFGIFFGFHEQFLGFFREGFGQRIVTDFAHEEVLELAPIGLLAVQLHGVQPLSFEFGIETVQVPVTACYGIFLFLLRFAHTCF